MIFVTALFFPERESGYRKADEYFRLGRFLVEVGVPLCIYTSHSTECRIRESWAGIDFCHVELRTDVEVEEHWKRDDVILPQTRSLEKDTAHYLCVQLSKLKFLAHAAARTTHLAWIDYGIFHMIKEVADAQNNLRAIARILPQLCHSKILTPCGRPYPVDVWNATCWKFLGSVLFGGSQAFQDAYRRQTELVLENLPNLTWEINYWSLMDTHFLGYDSNHNDTILSTALKVLRDKDTRDMEENITSDPSLASSF